MQRDMAIVCYGAFGANAEGRLLREASSNIHVHIHVHRAGESDGDARSRSRSPPGAYALQDTATEPEEIAEEAATEPEEIAEEEAPEEFQVTLHRETRQRRMGISAQRKLLPPEFKIMDIGEGLVSQWNKENPNWAVMPGDTIVEVNGVNASTEEMSHQFANALELSLKIRPGIGQW